VRPCSFVERSIGRNQPDPGATWQDIDAATGGFACVKLKGYPSVPLQNQVNLFFDSGIARLIQQLQQALPALFFHGVDLNNWVARYRVRLHCGQQHCCVTADCGTRRVVSRTHCPFIMVPIVVPSNRI